MDKFWMIVKMDGGNSSVPYYGQKYIYHSKEDAEIQLLYLTKQKTWEGDEYYLMECVARAERILKTDVYRVEPIE